MAKISAIIPIYNGEDYLTECLESVLAQTFRDIEIICIDDASTDSTSEILREYQRQNKNIKIIANKINQGAGVSRNKGMDSAEGEYIIFLDADDVFEKDMLQKAVRRMEQYQADLCVFREDRFTSSIEERQQYSDSYIWWKELEKRGVFSPETIKDILFNLWNGWAWDKLFRKSFIEKNNLRFQEIRSTNDGFFVHGAVAVAEKITCLNEILVHHRININTSISNNRDASWECCYLYLHELKEYLENCDKYHSFEKSFLNWAADFLYWNYQSLNEENRQRLFYVLRDSMLNNLGLFKYGRKAFYNSFHYWFIQEIKNSADYKNCKIPVEGTKKWVDPLLQNEEKIEELFSYLQMHRYHAAVWGVGERGKQFLRKYSGKKELVKIYDMDEQKRGCKIEENYVIETFGTASCKGIDFIIVMNSAYLESVIKSVKAVNPHIVIFDLASYLSFPMSIEECEVV